MWQTACNFAYRERDKHRIRMHRDIDTILFLIQLILVAICLFAINSFQHADLLHFGKVEDLLFQRSDIAVEQHAVL